MIILKVKTRIQEKDKSKYVSISDGLHYFMVEPKDFSVLVTDKTIRVCVEEYVFVATLVLSIENPHYELVKYIDYLTTVCVSSAIEATSLLNAAFGSFIEGQFEH